MQVSAASLRMTILLVTALSASCAAVRNPALDRARDVYDKARQDPAIVRNAGVALDKAGQTLEAAERLWTKEHDVAEECHPQRERSLAI